MSWEPSRRRQVIEPVEGPPPAGPPVRELLFGDLWDPEPVDQSRVTVDERGAHLLQGVFVAGDHHVPCLEPATGETLCEVPTADARILARAVRGARRAGTPWRALPSAERARTLFRIGRQLARAAAELAILRALDGGVPVRTSRAVDVPLAAAWFLSYAGWADKLEHAFPGARVRPLGVVAAIVPPGAPLVSASATIAPALAAGCTVVLAVPQAEPLAALHLGRQLQQIGLPPGTVNIVLGDAATGRALAAHDGVDGVVVAGRPDGDRGLRGELVGRGRRLTLVPQGPPTAVVLEDAPLDEAVEGIVSALARTGLRLLVQESVRDAVLARLADRLATLRVGDPLDRNTDVGPVRSQAALEHLDELRASGRREGATLHELRCDLPGRGSWCRPAYFTGVTESHRIAREPPGAPLATVATFRTPAEAISLAPACPATSLWTDKGSTHLALATRLRTSVVWGNGVALADPTSPAPGPAGGRLGLAPHLHVEGQP